MSKRNFNNFAEQTENVANETIPVEDYVEDVLNTPAEESVPATNPILDTTVKPVETPAVEIKKVEPKVEVKPEPKTVKVQRGTVRC